MKFKPGNILEHSPTKTKWIILSAENIEKRTGTNNVYKLEVEAFCVYVGEHDRANRYWDINQRDTFMLTQQDLNPTDFVWEVKSEV